MDTQTASLEWLPTLFISDAVISREGGANADDVVWHGGVWRSNSVSARGLSPSASMPSGRDRTRRHPAADDVLQQRQTERVRLGDQGIKGAALFEAMASQGLQAKAQACASRCPRCWHDREQRCICKHLPHLETQSKVKVLIVQHHKEYLSAGDDAKLLLAMLPSSQVELFVYGQQGDWERLAAELAVDPVHTLVLWPGEGALTTQDYVAKVPSLRHRSAGQPTLRVVVLDGTYRHALNMFKSLRKRLKPMGVPMPPHVALHPKTLSVYHRAQHGYREAMAASVAESDQPEALRMCVAID